MKQKRKTKTSTAVKGKWLKENYDQISVRYDKNLVKQFRQKCAASQISMASVIKAAIEDFLQGENEKREGKNNEKS